MKHHRYCFAVVVVAAAGNSVFDFEI